MKALSLYSYLSKTFVNIATQNLSTCAANAKHSHSMHHLLVSLLVDPVETGRTRPNPFINRLCRPSARSHHGSHDLTARPAAARPHLCRRYWERPAPLPNRCIFSRSGGDHSSRSCRGDLSGSDRRGPEAAARGG